MYESKLPTLIVLAFALGLFGSNTTYINQPTDSNGMGDINSGSISNFKQIKRNKYKQIAICINAIQYLFPVRAIRGI
tara:strand:+ start:199 stop:429 length:231 start_codon:yes stop_codon:yes gene_type:complete